MSIPDQNSSSTPRCAICHSRKVERFFTLPDMPTLVGAVWNNRNEAINAPCGEIALSICADCGYVFNRSWRSELVTYAPGYEISLHHSAVYRHFLEETASDLIDRYGLKGKRIVEIGCGSGYFLDLICRLGENQGYGFDPTLEDHRIDRFATHSIQLVRGYYDARWSHLKPDFVCCRHVFQSAPDPLGFLEEVAEVIGRENNTPCYVELPNASYVFDPAVHWDIMFEYRSFFTPESLTVAFQLAGYKVVKAQACYEAGQYMMLEAVPEKAPAASVKIDRNRIEPLLTEIRVFYQQFNKRLTWWAEMLANCRAGGKRLLGWGAGGRAVTYLCALDVREQMPYVVDINPNRQGAFLPRTGQQIVPPEFVKEYRPDVIVVTNPTYLSEIRSDVASMGITCDFVTI